MYFELQGIKMKIVDALTYRYFIADNAVKAPLAMEVNLFLFIVLTKDELVILQTTQKHFGVITQKLSFYKYLKWDLYYKVSIHILID